MVNQQRANGAYEFVVAVATDTFKLLLKIMIPLLVLWSLPKMWPYIVTMFQLAQLN